MSDDIGIIWEPRHSPDDFVRALKRREQWLGPPLQKFLKRCGVKITSLAHKKAPVDRGQLSQSIVNQVDSAPVPLYSAIGTNKSYGPAMEYGTRSWSEKPSMTGNTPLPTGPELDVWAKRHGFQSGDDVAAIIRMRDGVKPRRYLRNAFAEARRFIARYAKEMGKDIEAAWHSMNH